MKILAENRQHLKRMLFACFNMETLGNVSGLTALPTGGRTGGEYI